MKRPAPLERGMLDPAQVFALWQQVTWMLWASCLLLYCRATDLPGEAAVASREYSSDHHHHDKILAHDTLSSRIKSLWLPSAQLVLQLAISNESWNYKAMFLLHVSMGIDGTACSVCDLLKYPMHDTSIDIEAGPQGPQA